METGVKGTRRPGTRVGVVAEMRSGGQMLMIALDSHPHICAYRGEPARPDNRAIRMTGDKLTIQDAAWIALYPPACPVTAIKMTYKQAWELGQDWMEHHFTHLIHLTRLDALAQVVSITAANQRNLWHSYTPVEDLQPYGVSVDAFVQRLRKLLTDRQGWTGALAAMNKPMKHFAYEDLTSGILNDWGFSISVQSEILGFLGLPYYPMIVITEKLTRQPPEELIVNWQEVIDRVKKEGLYDAARPF